MSAADAAAPLEDADAKRELWARCVSQIDLGGAAGVVTFQSADHARPERVAGGGAVPAALHEGVWFCLTAHNPMGNEHEAAFNAAANARLEADLAALDAPRPAAVRPSAGMDETASWREDGFAVQFALRDADAGAEAVLRLARAYQQAAVFSYRAEGGRVLQRCVACSDDLRGVESCHPIARVHGQPQGE